ncbi:MAG TPA: hypothetical protein VE868_06435 [Balneolaceae bacterium]|nr:hypothetical protein [Balneolaceae bacterium]
MFLLLLSFLQKANQFSTSSEGREYAPPSGPLYYIILVGASLIVLLVIILMIKGFLWPGENSENHIKRKILRSENNHKQNNE